MIPFATTTITVRRRTAGEDAYTETTAQQVCTQVRAHIGSPSGRDLRVGGDQQMITDRLDCDVIDLRPSDQVTDDGNCAAYEVVWTRHRRGLGLDHLEAGLVEVIGAANG
jgi:hypothetical protein